MKRMKEGSEGERERERKGWEGIGRKGELGKVKEGE